MALYTPTQWSTGETITASKLNSINNDHANKNDPLYIDDDSPDVSTMRTQTDPGDSGSESLATTLQGEIRQLRFAIAEVKGTTYWYDPPLSPTFTSTDAGASTAPLITLYRNSASPADNDEIGEIRWTGKDDGGNNTVYGQLKIQLNDVTDTTEDSQMEFAVVEAGSLFNALELGGPAAAVEAKSNSGTVTFQANRDGSGAVVQFARADTIKGAIQVTTADWVTLKMDSTNNVIWTLNAGTPESSVTAGVGSLCSDVTNGKLYFKASGTGNTGWVVAGTQA